MKVPYAQQVQSYIVANENVDGGCNQHENDNVRFVHLLCGSKVSNKLEYCVVLCVCLQNLRVLLANENRQALFDLGTGSCRSASTALETVFTSLRTQFSLKTTQVHPVWKTSDPASNEAS